MMASIPQSFQHPGMAGHAGMPPGAHPGMQGHPGAQGMPGAQPGMMPQQMHAGMGGQQMNPNVMMNIGQMTPGMGGPNAHAMSHLNPGHSLQQQFIQQQQQQAALNPQFLQQQQLRQAQAHQRQQIMMQQAAQAQGGMSLNQQQQLMMGQRMAANGMALPPHLAQGQQAGHPQFMGQQHTPQQLQLLALQQQQHQQQQQQQQQAAAAAAAAAQQAASQAGATPGQPTTQPMRPPSTMAGGPEGQANVAAAMAAQQAAVQQAAAAQQAQQAQQTQASSQAPPTTQAQPGSQATPHTQNAGTPQPQSTPQQPQAQPPSQTPQQPGPPGQQAGTTDANAVKNAQMQAGQRAIPAGMNPLQFPRAQMEARAQAERIQLQQQQQKPFALKLFQFCEGLSSASLEQNNNVPGHNIDFWKAFVKKHFADTGVLRQEFQNSKTEQQKQFEVPAAVIPRYYYIQFTTRIKHMQLTMDNLQERELQQTGGHYIECTRATFYHCYSNGHYIVMRGSLKVHFNREVKIDLLEFSCQEWDELVQLKSIPDSPDQKQSPTLNKKNQKGQPQRKGSLGPKTIVNDWGLTEPIKQNLEIIETFNHMGALFDFAREHNHLTPFDALRHVVANFGSNMMNQGGNLNPNMQSAAGTPNASFNGPQHFNSPGGPHLGLPNTASPASMNMSPAMQAHGLQQAGGSAGASANTSPNVTGKRRRGSQVKMELDGDNPNEIGGPNKVKQSPRVGKRMKGT